MSRTLIPKSQWANGLWLVAAIIILSMISANIYLMLTRPVVADHIPLSWPRNWICQRVLFSSYCVVISSRDRLIYESLQLLSLFISVPVLLIRGFVKQFKKPEIPED